MIIPTVGRIVWYHPGPNESISPGFNPGQPGICAAIITNVWTDSMVSLCVFDANGVPTPRTSVYLDQAEIPDPNHGSAWCSWPTIKKEST